MTRLCQARMDSSGHGDCGDRCGAHGLAAAWGVTYPMSHGRSVMKATLLSGILAATIALAAPAHADVDTDFANELHTYGIYGQRDYNAWLAKITCERLYKGVDTNAEKSAEFLSHNLPRGTSTAQTWQFLAAINTYCPDQQPVLAAVAGPNR